MKLGVIAIISNYFVFDSSVIVKKPIKLRLEQIETNSGAPVERLEEQQLQTVTLRHKNWNA